MALAIMALLPPEGSWPHGATAQAPGAANDDMARATLIRPRDESRDTFPYQARQGTAGATLEQGESAPCAMIGASVWFEYVSDRDGTLEITTFGSDFDTVLAAYDAGGKSSAPPLAARFVPVTCNDDAEASRQSRISLTVRPFQTTYIQVAGRDGATGNLELQADCNPACRPNNDDRAFALPLKLDARQSRIIRVVDTRAALTEPDEARPCGEIGKTVWWSFYAGAADALEIDTSGSNFNTVLALYDLGFPGDDDATMVGCGTGERGNAAKLTLNAVRGHRYLLQAGGLRSASGELILNLGCVPACRPLADDAATGFAPPFEYADITDGATLQAHEPRPCGNIGKTVWVVVQVYGDYRLVLDASGSDFPVAAAVYTGEKALSPPGGLTLVGCQAPSGTAQPRISWDAKSQTRYWIQAGGRDGASGELVLRVACELGVCPPGNDPQSLAPCCILSPEGLPYSVVYDNRAATTEDGEPLDCGNMSKTVWIQGYAFVQNVSTQGFTIDTAGTGFAHAIAVYEWPGEGASFAELRRIGCGVSAGSKPASVRVDIDHDMRFLVQLGAQGGASGEGLILNVRAADSGTPAVPGIRPPDTGSWGGIDEGISYCWRLRNSILSPLKHRAALRP